MEETSYPTLFEVRDALTTTSQEVDTQPEPSDFPSYYYSGGMFIFLMSLVGLVVNLLLFRVTLKLRNPFYLLCASHLLSDSLVLIVYVGWVFPVMMFNVDNYGISSIAGALGNVGQYCSMYVTVMCAINRLMAVYSPIEYRNIFSLENTARKFIPLAWLLGWSTCAVFFFDGCHLFFDSSNFWCYEEGECAQNAAHYIDFVYFVFATVVTMLMNGVSLVKLRMIKNKRAKDNGSWAQNVRLGIQSFTVSLFYVWQSCFYYIIIPMLSMDPVWIGLIVVFQWAACHVGLGIILVAFNVDIRSRLCGIQPDTARRTTTITAVTTSNTNQSPRPSGRNN